MGLCDEPASMMSVVVVAMVAALLMLCLYFAPGSSPWLCRAQAAAADTVLESTVVFRLPFPIADSPGSATNQYRARAESHCG